MKNYFFFIKYSFLLLLIFFISRFSLVLTHNISLDYQFFLYSLRMDTIIISALLIMPIILFTFNLVLLTRILLTVILLALVYLEVADYFFFEEFNTRLNYLFVEYLVYPKEVIAMIWKSYKFELMILIPSLVYIGYKFFKYSKYKIKNGNILVKIVILPFILVLLFLGVRSSISVSTPNQSFYSYSNSTVKNDIVDNSIFSLLYAMYLQSNDKMPNFGVKDDNLIANIQKYNKKNYINSTSLWHNQKSTFFKKDKIVLTLMESFGNSYVGCIGGTPTSPNFDAMTKDGLFMSNMYSSSNRSNRGFEAVTSSLFPVFANSYLKLPKSQNRFYTIAQTMHEKGYETIFLYGGDSKFDNMKGFALSNGFDKVIDGYDFDPSIKRSTWGINDEELYKKAAQLLKNSKKPIFLVMFTLSSHKPFDYPDNKIELYKKAKKASFANGIKYADWALGKFYKTLKKDKFFDNGVLALVADHNAHMYADQPIAVDEFKIPALFIAKDLNASQIDNVTHQIDMAPTLLDIAGIDANTPFMGNDLTKKTTSSALIVRNGVGYAYLKNDYFVLYQPNKNAIIYNYNYNVLDSNKSKIQEGLDYIYGSYEIYDKNLHKEQN